jgi:hypothetical protein
MGTQIDEFRDVTYFQLSICAAKSSFLGKEAEVFLLTSDLHIGPGGYGSMKAIQPSLDR